MRIGAFIITGLMLILWGVPFGLLIYYSLKQRPRRNWRGAIAGLLVMWGVSAWFITPLSGYGYLTDILGHAEWPVGFARNVLTTQSGVHVVPHEPSGRIQIYDAQWRFIRGWNIDAGGGAFKIIPLPDDRIEAVTARGSHRFTYTIDGTLISDSQYSGNLYGTIPDQGISVYVRTFPLLWPLAHPLAAFALIPLGLLVLAISGQIRHFRWPWRKTEQPRVQDQ